MRLDENRTLFEKTINETSVFLDINREYVEKDYWLVLILKNIMSKNRGYVFKGGTSLSKCYHLINRFSEDIDISYSDSYDSLPVTEVKRKFKGIINSINEAGLEILDKDHLRRSAYFNQFQCPYNSLFDNNQIEKKVVVELAGQTPSFPTTKKTIQSFVGEYLSHINRNDLVEQYSLEPFEVVVQSLARTIIDKTFAICDYQIDKRYKKHSRHLYDLYKIMSSYPLNDELVDIFKEVREYRKKIPVCKSAKEGLYLWKILDEIIENNVFKEDYEKMTFHLLYDHVDYQTCLVSLKNLQTFLKQNSI